MDDCSSVSDLLGSLGDFGLWEEEVAKVVNEAGCRLSTELLLAVDDHLAAQRDEGLRHLGYRSRKIVTRFGEITMKRRLYRDGQGKGRFLLDPAIGLAKRKSASPSVAAMAATLAAHLPFRVAARALTKVLPETISHQSIHNLVRAIGESRIMTEERERTELFSDGVLPEGDPKEVSELFVEADGTIIALQREAKRRGELKVGVAYSAKTDGRTTDKVVHLDICRAEPFWEHMTVKLAKAFDLTAVEDFLVGGDGAAWVKKAKALFPNATFHLDRFHLFRALRASLGFTKSAFSAYQAAISGRLDETLERLSQAAQGTSLDKAETIHWTKRYLLANREGIGPGPSLGTIESNVDKLAANRMKKRGMSWTIAGARRMAKLIELEYDDLVDDWAGLVVTNEATKVSYDTCLPSKALGPDPQAWLAVHLAPLDGPYADRPWAKALREISRGSPYVTGIAPTKR